MSFVKLDCGIIHSSLWGDKPARDIFLTALILAVPRAVDERIDQIAIESTQPTGWSIEPGAYGFVAAARCGLARSAGVDADAAIGALERLGAPDPESRTPDHDGRRLVRVAGGFIVLNYDLYRERDETAAERMRRYRNRQSVARNVTPVTRNAVTLRVTGRNVTHADAEADAECRGEGSSPLPPEVAAQRDQEKTPSLFAPQMDQEKDGVANPATTPISSAMPPPADLTCQSAMPRQDAPCGSVEGHAAPMPTPNAFAHIPTELEFMSAFELDPIPRGWLLKKFQWFENNNAWTNGSGRLKNWGPIVRGWWVESRSVAGGMTTLVSEKPKKKKFTDAEMKARLDQIYSSTDGWIVEDRRGK